MPPDSKAWLGGYYWISVISVAESELRSGLDRFSLSPNLTVSMSKGGVHRCCIGGEGHGCLVYLGYRALYFWCNAPVPCSAAVKWPLNL